MGCFILLYLQLDKFTKLCYNKKQETSKNKGDFILLGKTHMSIGITTTLAITRPDSLLGILTAVSVGAVGALISDIDVGSSIASKKIHQMNFIILFTVIILTIIAVIDLLSGFTEKIWSNANIFKIIIGILGFIAICAFGKKQPHRSFMHSFLALLLLDIAIFFIYSPFVSYFTIGFLSHLLLDSLNMRKLKLLYPYKKGFSFRLCPANGMANYILFWVGSALSVTQIILCFIQTVRK